MHRQLVWFPDGSPAAVLAQALPAEFEAHPLSEIESLRRRADDPEVLVVDFEADSPDAVHAALARPRLVPVVGLLSGAEAPRGWPATRYSYLPKSATPFVLAATLEQAFEHLRLTAEADRTRMELSELNAIGVRLSAERDPDTLLGLILTKAREITHSDAGSIYLVDEPDEGQPRLRFKLTQNDFVTVPFTEFTIPISDESVAGHVAKSGEILHLADAYAPPAGAPFKINRSFDQQVGYRTKSMLVVPMRTPAGETIGVLQLINCKRVASRRFPAVEAIERETIPYPERFMSFAASLASQAAVALQNSRLLKNIEALFEGFVNASVTAIESRDPTTSGHSFRVADLTVALAAAADRAEAGPFRTLRFTAEQIREIRYASLLHDFGKVGVREEVLVKAKKLYPSHLELIKQRLELIKRGVALRFGAQKLDALLREDRARAVARVGAWDAELEVALGELDEHLKAIVSANEPSVMAEDVASKIQHLAVAAYLDHLGEPHTVITPEEAQILSIPRGSLTAEEFKQIQSHVVHTYQFLIQIPWTKELRGVPEIARSHHEKLNGSGYPNRIGAAEIPVQSKMMTISDIFDALTASDRPYKAAVPVDRALDILGFERKAGAVDGDLLELFTAVKPWEKRPT
ncbi:MAG TPA: HD domain-containing phosphohydrolase [Pseudomonadales bacterium]|nr:HD domain-containing phosphohydrolase [Pseudomonadales bacterium]